MGFVSVVKNFTVGSGAVCVDVSSEAVEGLRFVSALEETRSVELEHWFEQVVTTTIEDLLDFSVAGVFKEALIIQVALI